VSEENVEIVQSIYEAVNRRDWDGAFRDQHPNVELTTPPGAFTAGTYRGREECQAYFEELLTAFEEVAVEPEEIVESGDQVAVVLRSQARPKAGSAKIEIRNGHLWTIRDGKVVSLRIFPEPEEALEAAGLRE
jgi:ketosteroid isomerase-like protein